MAGSAAGAPVGLAAPRRAGAPREWPTVRHRPKFGLRDNGAPPPTKLPYSRILCTLLLNLRVQVDGKTLEKYKPTKLGANVRFGEGPLFNYRGAKRPTIADGTARGSHPAPAQGSLRKPATHPSSLIVPLISANGPTDTPLVEVVFRRQALSLQPSARGRRRPMASRARFSAGTCW